MYWASEGGSCRCAAFTDRRNQDTGHAQRAGDRPYFHDGPQETLGDVVDHYNKGAGLHNPHLDQEIQPLALTEQDIDDLVIFSRR